MPSFLPNQLDGNVHRLLSRVLALHAAPKAKQTLDILWAGAAALVKDADRPGDLNQALIELGSTVCKVRDPSCDSCPLQRWCAAHEQHNNGAEHKVFALAPTELSSPGLIEGLFASRVQNMRRRWHVTRSRTSRSSARSASLCRRGAPLRCTP